VFPRQLAVIVVALTWLLGCSPDSEAEPTATPASFDCSRASGEIEKLVCTDRDIATLDRQLAKSWALLESSVSEDGRAMARAEQLGWIKGRNDCWKADDASACVVFAYRSRIVELDIATGTLVPNVHSDFDCEGLDEDVSVSWFNDTAPSAASVRVGDDETLTFRSRAASGARYSAPGVVAWEHRDELSLEWYGNDYLCRPVKAGAH
jgi:uncharacterized protein